MSVHLRLESEGFDVKTVNHFTAASRDGEVVAVFNTKARTVQVFGALSEEHHFHHRPVRANARNDARVMFDS